MSVFSDTRKYERLWRQPELVRPFAVAVVAALLGLALIVPTSWTYGYIVAQSSTLVNTFQNGWADYVGEVEVSVTVTHPYGDSYELPDDLSFPVTVDLGTENAGKTFGSYVANAQGCITLDVRPGSPVRIPEVTIDTQVTVSEDLSSLAGFSVDQASRSVQVLGGGVQPVVFRNAYSAAAAPFVQVTAEKVVVGRDVRQGDTFRYRVERLVDDEWVGVGTKSVTCTTKVVDGQEVVDEDSLKFDLADLLAGVQLNTIGVHSFRVTEIANSLDSDFGRPGGQLAGEFDLLVSDPDMSATLVVIDASTSTPDIASIDGTHNVHLVFESDYNQVEKIRATIDITVRVDDRSGQERTPEGFLFLLDDDQGTTIAQTEPSTLSGKAVLQLEFGPEDLDQLHDYTLHQVYGGQVIRALSYDARQWEIEAAVVAEEGASARVYLFDKPESDSAARRASGEEQENTVEDTSAIRGFRIAEPAFAAEMGAVPSMKVRVAQEFVDIPVDASDTYEAPFVNVYDPEDAVVELAGKTLLANATLSAERFGVYLFSTDTSFNTAGAEPVRAVLNMDAEGNYSLGDVVFSRVGTYYFVVREAGPTSASDPVSYDGTLYRITVTVVDEDGMLRAEVSAVDQNGVVVQPTDLGFLNFVVSDTPTGAGSTGGSPMAATGEPLPGTVGTPGSSGGINVFGLDVQTGDPMPGMVFAVLVVVLAADIMVFVAAFALLVERRMRHNRLVR